MKHLIAAALGWAALGAHANPVVIGFEQLGDLDTLSKQYAGVEFHGGLSLVSGAAGGSLNEFDFPPHSGVSAAFSDGTLAIDFTTAVSEVGGYFSYIGGLRLSAYSITGVQLGSVLSLFSNNTGTAGDRGSRVNEFIGLSAPSGGIARIVIESTDSSGGAFVFDDFSFNTDIIVRDLPEPSTWELVALATLAAAGARRRRDT